MTTPLFFNSVASITVKDPLAEILGAAEEGIFTYTYEDAVKLAGHSCPTVAGAYLMTQKGLHLLYGDEIPVRGEIKVLMNGKLGEGVVGVMANVAALITGATDRGGFHGLGGKFDRRGLLEFEAVLTGEMAFERLDTGKRVTLSYFPQTVGGNPKMQEWLGMILRGNADAEIKHAFQNAWQDRVKSILLDSAENPALITYTVEEMNI